MDNWIDMSKSNNNVKSLQRMNNYLSERYILRSVTYFIRLETLMGRVTRPTRAARLYGERVPKLDRAT